MKPGHSGQIGCESLALALLKLLDQVLDVLSNDLLGGCLLAADFLLAAAPAVAVVVAAELHVFVLLLFRRDRLSVFLTHGWETRRRLAEKNERSARRWESGGRARQVTKGTIVWQAAALRTDGEGRSARGIILRWAVHREGAEWNARN